MWEYVCQKTPALNQSEPLLDEATLERKHMQPSRSLPNDHLSGFPECSTKSSHIQEELPQLDPFEPPSIALALPPSSALLVSCVDAATRDLPSQQSPAPIFAPRCGVSRCCRCCASTAPQRTRTALPDGHRPGMAPNFVYIYIYVCVFIFILRFSY